jgi:dihydropyrimidine dehydrogenase (NAD+) subunit PreA
MGATTVQVCTAVMHYGFGIIREMTAGLSDYMDRKGFKRVQDLVGKALKNTVPWEDLNLNYNVIAKLDKKKCIGCMLCYAACEDGAHQAIGLGSNGSRVPYIIEENCVGCNLCSLVCPVEGCITMVEKKSSLVTETWKERTSKGNIPKTFDDPLAGGLSHKVPEVEKALGKLKG